MPTAEHIKKVTSEADDFIVKTMNEAMGGGLAVGIVHEGRLVYAKGFGVADQRQKRPVTPDTVFRIGSISKTFTSIGVMQLWEQGKVDLDAPVNKYLKHYKVGHPDAGAPPITLRHIFTHTTGLGDLLSLRALLPNQKDLSIAAKPGQAPSVADFYKKIGGITTELYPGSKWSYDNHAYGTLGQIIEDVSGQPFGDYMIEHVFEPLGMMKSDYYRSDRVRELLAEGYMPSPKGMKIVNFTDIVVPGAGSIFSSVNEMHKYVSALMNGGKNEHGTVLKPETLEMMYTPQYQHDPRLPAMGITFWLENADGHRIVWHGGGWPGFISAMMVAPDDKVAVLAFTNASNRVPWAVAGELMRRLLDVPAEKVQPPYQDIPSAPHIWSELTGVYMPKPGISTNGRVWATYGGGFQVLVQGGQLTLQSFAGAFKGGLPLYPADKDDPYAFQLKPPPSVSPWTPALVAPNWVLFKKDKSGKVDHFELGFLTFYRQPQLADTTPQLEPVDNLVNDLRRRIGAAVSWYFTGMPNKLKVAGYALPRLLFLLWVLGLLRRRR